MPRQLLGTDCWDGPSQGRPPICGCTFTSKILFCGWSGPSDSAPRWALRVRRKCSGAAGSPLPLGLQASPRHPVARNHCSLGSSACDGTTPAAPSLRAHAIGWPWMGVTDLPSLRCPVGTRCPEGRGQGTGREASWILISCLSTLSS